MFDEERRDRIRALESKKRRLMGSIVRNKKNAAKARVTKRKINEELRILKGKQNKFMNMTPEDAQTAVAKELADVAPGEIYVKDLEREFDKVDRKAAEGRPERDIVDLDDIDVGIGEEEEEGVLDMSGI